MFKDQDSLYEHRNLFIWFLLAFQGGALNTGGFLAVHRFVSHVTGFATLAGVAGAKFDWNTMFGMLMVPLCFLLGVSISAWNVERQRIKNKSPRYSLIFSIIFFNICLILILGTQGYLGEFGESLSLQRDYLLLFLLSFTCGLQNAVISSASGAVIRTTHLTGLTTDLGIGLVRLWTTREDVSKRELFANWCRFGIFWSFVGGSLVSAMLYLNFKFYGFLLPLFITCFTAIRLRVVHIKNSKAA
ncbi:MAG: YoaK family protein [Bacteriovorax sp.]|nr:YoaK family protein [Bacteriovorax sp.]